MAEIPKIYIGTSGWSYPKGEGTWKGYFYPKGNINELEYYGQFFNTVEINSTFYRPPNPGYVYNWIRRVPDDFQFSVKLWQKFTHPKMYEEATGEEAVISKADVDLFINSISPLAKSGKLGVLLAQFPPSFRNGSYGWKVLKAVVKTFSQFRLAIELRHRSWSDDEQTAQFFKDNNVIWVQIDEPKFYSSIAKDLPLTSDTAYFRFHGRNAEMWWEGNNETRYQYLYSPKEISELAERMNKAADKAKLMFAYFNNHWQAYAPRNAVDMVKALGLPFEGSHIPLFKD